MTAADFSRFVAWAEAAEAAAPEAREALLASLGATPEEAAAVLVALERSRSTPHDELAAVGRALAQEAGVDASGDDAVPQLPAGLRVVRSLGKGGGGSVWLVEQESPKRRVAVKVLAEGGVGSLEAETDVVAALVHPHIVRVFFVGRCDVGRERDRPFVVMEYVEGATLRERMRADGATAPGDAESAEAALRALLPLVDALAYAHGRAVVHGDVSPRNVMIRAENGSPVLLDFGLAARLTDGGAARVIAHTPGYGSPEVGRGEAATCASDVYSLGTLLVEAATGVRPQGPAAAPATHGRRSTRSILDAQVAAVLVVATDPDPARRYPHAGRFAEDLRRALARKPILARSPSPAARARLFVRRRPGLVAAVSLLCALGGVAFGFWRASVDAEAFRALNAAKLAYQSGDWAGARRAAAAAFGGVVEVEARLLSVDAQLGANDVAAVRIWAASVGDDAPAALKAKARLALADVGALTSSERLSMLAEARALDALLPADALFAEGLAAPTFDEAAHALEKCLVVDPYHARASWTLTLVDMMSGRLDRAQQRLELMEFRWPGDPDLKELRATLRSQRGENAGLRRPTSRPESRVAFKLHPKDVPPGVDPIDREAHALLDPRLSPSEVVAALDRSLRLSIVDTLSRSKSGFGAQVALAARLGSLFAALSARAKAESDAGGLGTRLSMPYCVERVRATFVRYAFNPLGNAAKLREVWPNALTTHLVAGGHFRGKRYREAREALVAALHEPDVLPGLRAGRARVLANACAGEVQAAQHVRTDVARETFAAARLAVEVMLEDADGIDIDKDFFVDASSTAQLVAVHISENLRGPRSPTPRARDLVLCFRVLDRWRTTLPDYPRDDDLDGDEFQLWWSLGAKSVALRSLEVWLPHLREVGPKVATILPHAELIYAYLRDADDVDKPRYLELIKKLEAVDPASRPTTRKK